MGKQLTNLPPEIGNLTNLTRLNLTDSDLTELPPEIGKLANLTILNMKKNNLTKLPPEIGKLTNLKNFNLSENQLNELPAEIGKLTNLTSLDLSGNNLTELLIEIGDMTSLTELYLNNCNLTKLPKEIGYLTDLTKLELRGNHLTILPIEFENLTKLVDFRWEGNPFDEQSLKRAKRIKERLLQDSISILFNYYKELHTVLTKKHTEKDLHDAVFTFTSSTNKFTDYDKYQKYYELIMSLIEYLYNEAPDDEQNLFMVAELIDAGIKEKGYEKYERDLDILFSMLEEKDKNHIALKHYYKAGSLSNSFIETCRSSFSAIGKPNNVFKYVREQADIEILAQLICISFGDNSNKSDIDRLSKYLIGLYNNSQKTGKPVKSIDLKINMFEIEKLKSFWSGCDY